jgi:hypothetical protein
MKIFLKLLFFRTIRLELQINFITQKLIFAKKQILLIPINKKEIDF